MLYSYRHTKVNLRDRSSNSDNPKMKAKTTKKTFRLLTAKAFRYHYESFCSQIHLTKLAVVKGEPDHNLVKKWVRSLGAVFLKI